MKDQYVGDISDFEKYAILGALAAEAGLPLAVCWMLTTPDERGEGGRIDYLKQPKRYGTWTRMPLTAWRPGGELPNPRPLQRHLAVASRRVQ